MSGRRGAVTTSVFLLLSAACTNAEERAGRGVMPTPRQTRGHADTIRTPSRLTQQPNVLIILTDDQRADQTLQVMPKTRRWFQREGTRFARAFATTPLCCPSRASILTGRYAHNHGIQTNYDPSPLDVDSLLPRYLQQTNYQTAIVGKFLNSWPVATNPPHFDMWAIEDAYRYYDSLFNINGRLRNIPSYSTSFIRKQSLRFIKLFERQDGRPWFLLVAPLAPHDPFTPHPRYVGEPVPVRRDNPATPERDRAEKPAFIRDTEVRLKWTYQLPKRQMRTLKSVDDMVGKIFQTLETFQERDQTLAFFLSDNGYLWGEHGMTEKRVPYTPSVRIPLLVRWPGFFPAGATDRRMVATIDIAPTILDAAHIRLARSQQIDGKSLFGDRKRERLLLEYWRDPAVDVPQWAAVRTNRYEYAEYYEPDGETLFREYYDLVRDPWQLSNLLAGDPPRNGGIPVKRLSNRLARYRRCQGKGCP